MRKACDRSRLPRRIAEEDSDSDSDGGGRKACDRSRLPRRIAEEDSDGDTDGACPPATAAIAAAAAATAAAVAAAVAPPVAPTAPAAGGAGAIDFQCIDYYSALTDLEVGVTLLRSHATRNALDVFVVTHGCQWRRCGDFAEASPSALRRAGYKRRRLVAARLYLGRQRAKVACDTRRLRRTAAGQAAAWQRPGRAPRGARHAPQPRCLLSLARRFLLRVRLLGASQRRVVSGPLPVTIGRHRLGRGCSA